MKLNYFLENFLKVVQYKVFYLKYMLLEIEDIDLSFIYFY